MKKSGETSTWPPVRTVIRDESHFLNRMVVSGLNNRHLSSHFLEARSPKIKVLAGLFPSEGTEEKGSVPGLSLGLQTTIFLCFSTLSFLYVYLCAQISPLDKDNSHTGLACTLMISF